MAIHIRLVEKTYYRLGFNKTRLYVQKKGFFGWDYIHVFTEEDRFLPLRIEFENLKRGENADEILIHNTTNVVIPDRSKIYKLVIHPKIFVKDFDFSS